MDKSVFCYLTLCMMPITGLLSADRGLSVEVRASAFFHTSERFRDVYGDVDPSYGIEVSFPFQPPLDLWVDCDYFYGDRSQSSCCKSRIDIVNSSFGIKYLHPLHDLVHLYLGLGPSFSWLYFKNKTCCGDEHHARLAPGLVVKSGITYQFFGQFFLDVFADYIYQPIHFENTVDIGGLKAGLGLGVHF